MRLSSPTSSFLFRWCGLLLLVLLMAAPAVPAAAQAVQPGIGLTRPADGAANRLDLLRTREPRIALLDAQHTARQAPGVGSAQAVRDARHQWELLLLGLNLPYVIIDDRGLERGPDDAIQVLLLPAAEALSGRQRDRIRRFVARGGGVIASGRVGVFSERGALEGDAFFRELFGAELVQNLPEQTAGLLQGLDGGHALTGGVPPGFRLNLAPQLPTAAARPLTTTAVGRPYTYTHDVNNPEDAFADLTLALYGRYRDGRVVWTRFLPQDVSRAPEQQTAYQAFVLNALAYAASTPSVAVRAWPQGRASATTLAMLPLVGPDASFPTTAGRILDALGQTPATFFLTAEEAARYPDLVRRMDQAGEIALSADTDAVLKKGSAEVQTQRIQRAETLLRGLHNRPLEGLHPPGGFFDVGTIEAMYTAGMRYLLLPAPRDRLAPGFLDWHDQVDFRAPFLAQVTTGATRGGRPAVERLVAVPVTGRDDYTVLTRMGLAGEPAAQLATYRADFERIHAAGGLYVLPFRAELQGATDDRARVLREVAAHADRRNSWVTTLREAQTWFRGLQQLSVVVTEVTDRSMAFEVTNAGTQPLAGVAFDVRPGRVVRRASANTNANVQLGADGASLLVTVPSLPAGTSRLTITFD